MARRLLLLTLVGLLTYSSAGVAVAADATCSVFEINAGLCDVSAGVDGENVVLEGETAVPGSDGATTPDGIDDADDDGPAAPVDPNADCLYVLNGRCLAMGPGRTTAVQPITLADIASFRPDAGVDSMEPNGWMIVGLDTNFFASGGVQVKAGTLLGQPASVRFTPVQWNWTYGDGSSASRATPGAPWASQGIREFDPTATSHVYRSPGTYNIDLTIDYSAEYRFAGMPWLPIAGTLNVPANRLVASAGDAKTVLVERECTVNPAGPGC